MKHLILILILCSSTLALADPAKPSPLSGKLKKMKINRPEPSPDSSPEPSPQKD